MNVLFTVARDRMLQTHALKHEGKRLVSVI